MGRDDLHHYDGSCIKFIIVPAIRARITLFSSSSLLPPFLSCVPICPPGLLCSLHFRSSLFFNVIGLLRVFQNDTPRLAIQAHTPASHPTFQSLLRSWHTDGLTILSIAISSIPQQPYWVAKIKLFMLYYSNGRAPSLPYSAPTLDEHFHSIWRFIQ